MQREGNRIFVKSISCLVSVTLLEANSARIVLYKTKAGTLTANTSNIATLSQLNYAVNWSGYSVIDDRIVEIPL